MVPGVHIRLSGMYCKVQTQLPFKLRVSKSQLSTCRTEGRRARKPPVRSPPSRGRHFHGRPGSKLWRHSWRHACSNPKAQGSCRHTSLLLNFMSFHEGGRTLSCLRRRRSGAAQGPSKAKPAKASRGFLLRQPQSRTGASRCHVWSPVRMQARTQD